MYDREDARPQNSKTVAGVSPKKKDSKAADTLLCVGALCCTGNPNGKACTSESGDVPDSGADAPLLMGAQNGQQDLDPNFQTHMTAENRIALPKEGMQDRPG